MTPEPDSSTGFDLVMLPGTIFPGLTASTETTAGKTCRAMASKRSLSAATGSCAGGAPSEVLCWAVAGTSKSGGKATAAVPPKSAKVPTKRRVARRVIWESPEVRGWHTKPAYC